MLQYDEVQQWHLALMAKVQGKMEQGRCAELILVVEAVVDLGSVPTNAY